MQDRVGALETAVDDADDHDLPPECAKIMRDVVFRAHLDVFRRVLLGDPPARVEPMTVRLQPGVRAVRVTPRASPIVHITGDKNCWVYLLSRRVPVCAHASVKYTEVLFVGSDKFRRRRLRAACRRARRRADPPVIRRWGWPHGIPKAVPGRVLWPPRDLCAGQGRLSEEATVGVCPPGGNRTPRGRCNDGSA